MMSARGYSRATAQRVVSTWVHALRRALGHALGVHCATRRYVSVFAMRIHNSTLSLNQNNAYVIPTICWSTESSPLGRIAGNLRPIIELSDILRLYRLMTEEGFISSKHRRMISLHVVTWRRVVIFNQFAMNTQLSN